MSSEETRAVVLKIVEGLHGPYAVAKVGKIGSVTFSLDKSVWSESERPEPGQYVILSRLRETRAGWRAKQGRFVQPIDVKQP